MAGVEINTLQPKRAILSGMRTVMRLHKTEAQADWFYVAPQDRNRWQNAAAASKGILTPGNAITAAGALLVLVGLIQLSENVTQGAILLIAFGRFADLADGFIADKTGTKSPLGEAVDASADKLLAFAAVITLLVSGLVPVLILAVIILQNVLNSLISIYGRAKSSTIHPTRSGKLAAAATWAAIVFYLFYYFFKDAGAGPPGACLFLAWLTFAAFVYFGAVSTFSYYKQARAGKLSS